ncbi:MAG: hypothetical protein JSU87_14640 [Gemmatimonadota bacterium]|nr:MAG: hypothetical protein JSU87_14640 [Gemmatimonadota bacterium]
MRLALLLLTLSLSVSPAAGQDAERPAGWKVRFDRPAPDSAVYFVSMEPGWHITTGPAGIFYDAERKAAGNYRLRSEISLFSSARLDGFGVFVGGQNLESESQAYVYFLIRKDGRFLIKRRNGTETEVITPWTENPAIVKHDGGEGTASNVLVLECGAEYIDFFVNDEKVASLPRAELAVEGIVGLRMNHGLDVHVIDLSIEATG